MIRSLILSLLVTLSASAATFPVADAPLGEPPDTRSVPELSAGRDGWLAVWTDARGGEPVLLAARVAADGSVLDPTGIFLAPTPTSAKVVWNGERHLVFFAHGPDLVMRSVAEDGTVGPVTTVVPHALVDWQEPFDVATNGQRIVIAYAGDYLSWQVKARMHAAVLAMDGRLIADLLLDEKRTDFLGPSVATNGSIFAVAWNRMVLTPEQLHDGYELHAVRLDGRGARLDAQARNLGHSPREAVLRANGGAFLGDREYEAWPVSADLSQTGAPVERRPGRFFTLHGAAAVVGEDHPSHTSAETRRYVEIAVYDAQGRPAPGTRVHEATPDGYHSFAGASAAQRGEDVLVAWLTYHYASSSRFRLFTAVASADPLVQRTAPQLLTRSAAAQRAPFLTAGETEVLVTWQQPDGIYAGRLTAQGRKLDRAGILLSERSTLHAPAAVYHGGRYAVAFAQEVNEQQWEVVVRFVTPFGGLQPETVRIPVDRWEGNVALASGGGSLVLVWMDRGLRATRIHPGGTYDPPVEVAGASWGALDPVVSFNGTHFLIAWIDTYLDFDWLYQHGISGRRMTPDLQFADAQPRQLVSFGFSRHHDEPALASNGSEWFLTWTHFTSPYVPDPPADEKKQVRIARIGADGSAESRFGRELTRGFASELAWTGSQLVVAWKDDVAGHPMYVAPVDAVAARRAIAGGLQVSLARWGNDWVAAYSRIGDAATGHVPRVFATFPGRKARAMR